FMTPGFGVTLWAFRLDPHTLLEALANSKGFNNLGAYNNPEVDRLIDEAAAIYDPAKAKPIYDRIQTMVADDALLVFVARGQTLYPMNGHLRGFVPYPTKFEHLEFLWFEK
ncbi:MAG: hypothetical protein HY663_07050, partial [Chloroflexi bacterium]|nr:hypothetical protein [Chloroflexota bacterium]